MDNILAYILVASIFAYYLGVLIAVTRLAVRSGRLKNFHDVSPEDVTILFDSLDGLPDHRQPKPRERERERERKPMFKIIIHILLIITAISSGLILLWRFRLVKAAAGKNSLYLLFWGLTLLLGSSYFILLLAADFSPQGSLAQLLPRVGTWIILATLIFLLISTVRAVSHYPLFRLLWVVPLLSLVFSVFFLLFSPFLESSKFSFLTDPSSFLSIGIFAPLELLLSFLFLFLGLSSLGRHFWQWRFAGFLLIAFTLLILSMLNLSYPMLKNDIIPRVASNISLPLTIWQEVQGFLYFCLYIGFYLATLPRRTRKDSQHPQEAVR